MIRVAQVISDTNFGGAGRYLLAFLDHYDRKSFRMEVYLPENAKLTPELTRRNIEVVEIPNLEDKSFDLKAVSALYQVISKREPDIIHTHAALSARIAARLSGKAKIVYTRHSVFDPPKSQTVFPKKQLNGLVNRLFSDTIIAVSPAAKENLILTGTSPNRIRVVYNGVEKGRVYSLAERQKLRQKYHCEEEDFIAAVIARLVDVKGHEYILDCAAHLLKRGGEGVKFLIAGTGPLADKLAYRVKREKLTNVQLTGFVEKIEEIENIMDIQVNASYGTEATSFSLLEGMSMGKPAVVSNFGGNPYVISHGENGLVVPKKNSRALAEAILKIRKKPKDYEAMAKRAVEIYESRFTAKLMAQKICDIYKRVCLK